MRYKQHHRVLKHRNSRESKQAKQCCSEQKQLQEKPRLKPKRAPAASRPASARPPKAPAAAAPPKVPANVAKLAASLTDSPYSSRVSRRNPVLAAAAAKQH